MEFRTVSILYWGLIDSRIQEVEHELAQVAGGIVSWEKTP